MTIVVDETDIFEIIGESFIGVYWQCNWTNTGVESDRFLNLKIMTCRNDRGRFLKGLLRDELFQRRVLVEVNTLVVFST